MYSPKPQRAYFQSINFLTDRYFVEGTLPTFLIFKGLNKMTLQKTDYLLGHHLRKQD